MNFPCERCKAKATVHITDMMPEKTEMHLCDRCAEKEGIIVKQHHSTNAILHEFIKQKTGIGSGDGPTCPTCGMTFREFQSSGQLGCPRCYAIFRDLLNPLIERAHEEATHHVGKSPGEPSSAGPAPQAGLLRLRRQLQEAIEAENYEQAAKVRDEIKAIEENEAAGDTL
ncbi:MAG: UvrB/UvrC motif-containing protein [Phycisphaerae bacterium]